MLGGNLGSLLYGDVSVMAAKLYCDVCTKPWFRVYVIMNKWKNVVVSLMETSVIIRVFAKLR